MFDINFANKKAPFITRGKVIDNTGKNGRCKIFIPTIYPSEFENSKDALPWAEPAMPIFFGSGDGTGFSSVPDVNAYVWVFFNEGDHNYPVYFAAIPGKAGWGNDNEKQHTIQTNNFKLQIDETEDADRMSLEVTGKVNINIVGDVTQTIDGNVSQNVTGEIAVSSDDAINITAVQDVEITGNNVKVNANANVDVTATGIATISASQISLN